MKYRLIQGKHPEEGSWWTALLPELGWKPRFVALLLLCLRPGPGCGFTGAELEFEHKLSPHPWRLRPVKTNAPGHREKKGLRLEKAREN